MVVARSYFAAGREDEAFSMLEEALHLAESEEDIFLQAEIEILFGHFRLTKGQYKDSEAHFQKAIAFSKEGQFDECLLNAYRGASEASRKYDAKKALEYFELSTALKDSIFNESQLALIRDYQVRYDLAEKEHQLEIQEKNNRTQAAEIIILFVFAGLLIVIMVILIRLIRVRKKQNQTLARLNDTQNRILSVASHDVKNSVLAQNMVLKLANEHFDSLSREELKENMVALKKGSDELKDKLYTILHWIYGELGKEANPPALFNLLQTVEEGVRPHAEELKSKNLVVVNDIAPNLQCYDKVNVFNIVFQNLLTNAIKFSKEGGEITVRAVEEDKQVWVEVVDRGVGISQQRMQELMHETVKPTKGTYGERGTGIGLFVSRQLMVKNGGQLLIESVEGEGTTIRFNIKKPKP
jgi:signal transduction histidine kinase